MSSRAVVLGLALTVSACLGAGEERARLDQEVGVGSAGGVEVTVEDGLAAIRSLAPGELTLWAGAPEITVRMDADADAVEEWTVTVLNCMPDAELGAAASSGRAAEETVVEEPLATRKTWFVVLPRGVETRLSIGASDSDLSGPFRFAVLSDIQDAIGEVQDIFSALNRDPAIRFLVSTGDLTARGAESQIERVQEELERLQVPVFTTIGNHDAGASDPSLWHDLFGRHSSHFHFKGVAFSLVDSAGASIDPLVYRWLDSWLEGDADAVHLFFTHFPPLEPSGIRNGSFRSRAEAGKLVARLVRGRVDAMFFGHVHSFYAFTLGGIPAYISGGGGAYPVKLDNIGRHYLAVEVNPVTGVSAVAMVPVE